MQHLTDAELAERVANHLKSSYPLAHSPIPHFSAWAKRAPVVRRFVGVSLAAAASVVVALVVAYAIVPSQDHQGTVAGGDPAANAAPDWLKGCFIQWEPPRPQDSAYVGLKLSDASALASSRGEQLVFVAGDGKCVEKGSQVLYTHAVAVAFDRGSLESGVPADAVVTYANSSPEAKFDGWKLQ